MFDWNKAAEGQAAERVPPGETDLTITKVIFGDKENAFKSKAGDPQILLICQDSMARECSQMFTLSERAAWTLAQLLSAAGADLGRMQKDGVQPAHFAVPAFANANLVGRRFRANVEYETAENGKEFPRITPLRPRPQAQGQPVTPPPPPTVVYTAPAATAPAPPPTPQAQPVAKGPDGKTFNPDDDIPI